jgi:D-cysteine desulfhydrase family pyridoxal phosphate-dependent enzyme
MKTMIKSNNLSVLNEMHKKKICFSGFPTPLHEMPRLSKLLGGPKLLVKRDDMTDLAFGGNKARKLEFLFADAKNKGSDLVISVGAVQSNCACMVAAAARRLGMEPVLVLVGNEPEVYDGNLLLDKLLSAEIHFLKDYGPHVEVFMEKLAEDFKINGYSPYIIPVGASIPLTVPGYVLAFEELIVQLDELGETVDYIVCACGTGGTQAGLIFGNELMETDVNILGASVFSTKIDASKSVSDLVNKCAELFDVDLNVAPEKVNIFDDYIREGYAFLNEDVTVALKLVAKTEGIFLDPIYTGKAMVMLIDLIKKGYFEEDDNVVFFHTGGLPAIFLYRTFLSEV